MQEQFSKTVLGCVFKDVGWIITENKGSDKDTEANQETVRESETGLNVLQLI